MLPVADTRFLTASQVRIKAWIQLFTQYSHHSAHISLRVQSSVDADLTACIDSARCWPFLYGSLSPDFFTFAPDGVAVTVVSSHDNSKDSTG